MSFIVVISYKYLLSNLKRVLLEVPEVERMKTMMMNLMMKMTKKKMMMKNNK